MFHKTYSIICPVLNESEYIEDLIDFLGNVSPPADEIFFIDGMSTDGTRSIIKNAKQKWPKIQLIDNPDKLVPFALNHAIPLCTSDIIVRLDAHSKYAEDYFEKILETFDTVDADIVGGPIRTTSKAPFQEALAYVFNTPLGMGNSSVHDINFSGYTDSVTFGAWKREIFETTGLFDTRLKRNQDDEFHYRARSMGFKIYQNSDIKLWYYPRTNWKGLFKQYYQYGLYKPLVLKKIKSGLSIRHLIPSLFVLYLVFAILSSWYSPFVWLPFILYISLVLYFTTKAEVSPKARWLIPLVYPGVHLGYGIGFIFGLFRLK